MMYPGSEGGVGEEGGEWRDGGNRDADRRRGYECRAVHRLLFLGKETKEPWPPPLLYLKEIVLDPDPY